MFVQHSSNNLCLLHLYSHIFALSFFSSSSSSLQAVRTARRRGARLKHRLQALANARAVLEQDAEAAEVSGCLLVCPCLLNAFVMYTTKSMVDLSLTSILTRQLRADFCTRYLSKELLRRSERR